MFPTLTLVALVLSAPPTEPAAEVRTGPTFKIGGMMQPELTFFPGDGDDVYADGFQFRRLRTLLQVSWGTVSLKLVPEFAGSRVRGQDVFLDLTLHKDDCGSLVLRVGKDKPPISVDLLQSSTNVPFLERGPTAQLAADRDIGVSLLLTHGAFEAALMLGNGTADVSNVDTPTGDFEVYARAALALGPIHLSASGSIGEANEGGTLPAYRSNGRRALFDSTSSDATDTTRWRLGGALKATFGPTLFWVEAIHSEHYVGVGAWQAGASLLIGSDNAWNRYDKPGDIEFALRAGQLATNLFGGDEDTSRGATSAAFAASWTIDKHLKLMAGYEFTHWDGALNERADEHVVGVRLQTLVLETL